MAQTGLLSWCNDIRRSMASDQGRQTFSDRIQKDGFLFLDDYLDNILAGARQDGLIDLVKTPSRTKSSRQPRTASKLKNIVAISFDAPEKENAKPLHLFRDTHVMAKEKSPERPPPRSPLRNQSPSPFDRQPYHSPSSEDAPASSSHDTASLTIPTEQPDLSIIAEDDETGEYSQSNIQLDALKVLEEETPSPHEIDVSMDDTEAFQSIPLDSPKVPQSTPENINSDHAMDTRALQPPLSPISFGPSNDISMSTSDHAPFEQATPIREQPLYHSEQQDASLDNAPVVADDHITSPEDDDTDTMDTLPAPSRQSVTQFPSLPAPTHLQKTPGAGLGTRTSWLSKVRQTNKTLEVTGKKTSLAGLALPLPQIPAGGKRKSADSPFMGSVLDAESSKQHKVHKTIESDVAPLQLRKDLDQDVTDSKHVDVEEEYEETPSMRADVMRQLRKTMAAAQARGAMSKSLGGPAAEAALAQAREAKARAERNVGERNETIALALRESDVQPSDPSHSIHDSSVPTDVPGASTTVLEKAAPRFSVSELFPREEVNKPAPSIFHKPLPQDPRKAEQKESLPMDIPVFSNPQPVFRPPSPKASKVFKAASKPTHPSPFSMPASMSLGLGTRLPSPTGPRPQPLSKQSTQESMASDSVFDSQGPSWMPSTQDTDYSSMMGSQQSQAVYPDPRPPPGLDEDDSWPMSEKDGVQWTFGGDAEDSMTWSSAPTETRRLDQTEDAIQDDQDNVPAHPGTSSLAATKAGLPGSFDVEMDGTGADDEYLADNDISIDPSRMTVALVNPLKNKSQISLAESDSNLGFFGHATKLMNSVLGSGKKAKPEVKSLQLAAAAAKKDQEEKDKKAAVMKNMETRRQQALQKKADEDKARALAEEKKLKEEADKRKRDRDEEHTGKRVLVKPAAKKDDDTMKKRKLLAEPEKKELKKAPSKSNLAKSTFKPSVKFGAGSSQEAVEPKAKPTPVTKSKIAGPSKVRVQNDDDTAQPSQMLQSQMAARAQAQIQAASNLPPSESIELPDINSEYSDSDDEDRQRYQAPHWAQSPELMRALQDQADINPDDIFGTIQPLRMEEVFRTGRASRFRARTSSANWAGTDRLTQEEQVEYARRMGFRQ